MTNPFEKINPQEVLDKATDNGYFHKNDLTGKYALTSKGTVKFVEMVTTVSDRILASNKKLQDMKATSDEVSMVLITELYNLTQGSKDLTFLMLYSFDNNWDEFMSLIDVKMKGENSSNSDVAKKNADVVDFANAKQKKSSKQDDPTFH